MNTVNKLRKNPKTVPNIAINDLFGSDFFSWVVCDLTTKMHQISNISYFELI